jgi:Putative beta-barrel porin 2
MILPCRIHQTRSYVPSLSLALLFAAVLLVAQNEAMGQNAVPLEITAGVDFGYDDHVLGSSSTTSSSGQSSFFAKENLVLTYDRPGEQTEFRLLGIGRFTQFFDLGTDDKDVNLTASLTHNFTTRLSFNAEIYGAYQTEPNFQSNIGPTNVRAPHFDTTDTFSLTYRWLPRLPTVTSYTFQRIKYESSSVSTSAVGAAQDRFQNTLAERLQFSLTSRTSLTGEYRFEVIDYDTAPRDATIHFALAGLDHDLTEHLKISVLGGPSFRFFKDDGSTINPYTRVTLGYEVEQPTTATAAGNTTFRTGVNATYRLSSRINSHAGVYYHRSENQGPSGTSSGGPQDGLQFTLGLRYTLNKRFALHVDYRHTATSSSGGTSGYSRNQYFGGLTYTY